MKDRLKGDSVAGGRVGEAGTRLEGWAEQECLPSTHSSNTAAVSSAPTQLPFLLGHRPWTPNPPAQGRSPTRPCASPPAPTPQLPEQVLGTWHPPQAQSPQTQECRQALVLFGTRFWEEQGLGSSWLGAQLAPVTPAHTGSSHPQLQLWASPVLWSLFPPWSESWQPGFLTLHLRGPLHGLVAAPVSCQERPPSITGASWDGLCVQQGRGALPSSLGPGCKDARPGARAASWPPSSAGSWPQPGPRPAQTSRSCPRPVAPRRTGPPGGRSGK